MADSQSNNPTRPQKRKHSKPNNENHNNNNNNTTVATTTTTNSSIISTAFQQFQVSLDSRNEKREIIYKTSREITQLSKIIFLLQRVNHKNNEQKVELIKQAKQQFIPINKLILIIHNTINNNWDDYYRYGYQYSPGLQEYIEAHAFCYYLEFNSLITKEYIEKTIFDSIGIEFIIPPLDYLNGSLDLGGEIMRYSTTQISIGGGSSNEIVAFLNNVCDFMRDIYGYYNKLKLNLIWKSGIEDKLKVWSESTQKIEILCYKIHLRGAELPPNMLIATLTKSANPIIEFVDDATDENKNNEI